MPLSHRDNYLRNARFQTPEWIPSVVAISGATRAELGPALDDVLARHPVLFPGFQPGGHDYEAMRRAQADQRMQTIVDAWGCTWQFNLGGLEGLVVGHPLDDWSKLADWRAPDPAAQADRGPMDWEATRRNVAAARAAGGLTAGHTFHGFLFLRLTYLRGFENLLLDMAEDSPELRRVVTAIEQHTRYLVDQYVGMGVDIMEFADDLGTQERSLISPAMFARWCTPTYQAVMQPCREAGVLVGLHSDGYIMELLDEFAAAGVDIVNPQDLCNGIDAIARECKGRFCIRLDIDRQVIVPYGTGAEIRDLIEEEVRKLGSPEGGLEFICGVYPPTPPGNIDALCSALEEFRTYWWD
ncbi:MAG: hypothetical protein HYU66_11665 [Armatimonadetes bacterium]|nr:hypothetical protein [Armatimonadota bacterium]